MHSHRAGARSGNDKEEGLRPGSWTGGNQEAVRLITLAHLTGHGSIY